MKSRRRLVVWAAVAACVAVSSASCVGHSPTTSAPSHTASDPIADAPAGRIEGRAEGALRVFKGIPYASPPVGPARWRPPSPLPRWPDVRNAAQFGPACPQPKSRIASIYTEELGPTSEDCLTLNIWTAWRRTQGAGVRLDPRRGLHDGLEQPGVL